MGFIKLSLLGIFLSLAGCAGTVVNMQEISDEEANTGPAAGKSRVVFMRPSTLGFAIQSSVFEVVESQPRLVGIVAAKKKVSYEIDPGEHLFMVIGESADFMSAKLDPDKTYHALVTPRIGAWKARFSLRPVTQEELTGAEFNKWSNATSWVAKSADSSAWVADNLTSIKKKQNKYFPKWQEKGEENQPRLHPVDGL